MISFIAPKHHWNYFLAIEKDLENISRYIEFADKNLGTYSIELAHILLSASSEVDVIMKQLCSLVAPHQRTNNIDEYRNVIQECIPDFIDEEIIISRHGLSYKPWINWNHDQNPDWWKSHNKVKHQRNNHFDEANLKNTINAVGALLITVIYYYKYAFTSESENEVRFKDTTIQLKPESTFMTINADYYCHHLLLS